MSRYLSAVCAALLLSLTCTALAVAATLNGQQRVAPVPAELLAAQPGDPAAIERFQAMSYAEQLVEIFQIANKSNLTPQQRELYVAKVEELLANSRSGTRDTAPTGSTRASSTGVFQAGAAVSRITPPIGSPSAGYGGDRIGPTADITADPYDFATIYKSMEGQHDPLRAKALVLDNGQQMVVMLGIDAIAVAGFNDAVIAECQRRGLPLQAENLLAFATHTHSGPGAVSPSIFWQLFTVDFYQDRLFTQLQNTIADAIEEAYAKRRPAKYAAQIQEFDGISNNRRGDPGKYDKELFVLRVDGIDDTPIAVLFSYTAHPTALGSDNFLFSACFPGHAERFLEEVYPGIVAIFVNGAQGDVSPRAGGFAGSKAMGHTLAGWVIQLYENFAPEDFSTLGLFATSSEVVRMPMPYIRPGLEVQELPLWLVVEIGGLIGQTCRFSAFRLGCDIGFSTMPGEALTETGWLLKDFAKQHFTYFCYLGLSQEHFAYFATETEYWQGGYEALLSFFGPETGLLMSGYSIDQLDNTLINFPQCQATATPVPATATNTPEPTATDTPEPTATDTPEPTATDTPEPTPTDTPEPTATDTPEPTATNTPEPTATDTPEATPTATPV